MTLPILSRINRCRPRRSPGPAPAQPSNAWARAIWVAVDAYPATFYDTVVLVDLQDDVLRSEANGGSISKVAAADLAFEENSTKQEAPRDIWHHDPVSGRVVAAVRVGTMVANVGHFGRMLIGNETQLGLSSGVYEGFSAFWLGNSGANREGTSSASLSVDGVTQGSAWPFSGAYDGATSRMSLEDPSALLDGAVALTIEALFKADAIGTDRRIIAQGPHTSDDASHGILVRYASNGYRGGGSNVIVINILTADGKIVRYESASDVQTTDPQHLVIRWRANDRIYLHINGREDTPSYTGVIVGGFSFANTTSDSPVELPAGSLEIAGKNVNMWSGEIGLVSIRRSFAGSLRAVFDGRNRIDPPSVYGFSEARPLPVTDRPIVALPFHVEQDAENTVDHDVAGKAWDPDGDPVSLSAVGPASLEGANASAAGGKLRYASGSTLGSERVHFDVSSNGSSSRAHFYGDIFVYGGGGGSTVGGAGSTEELGPPPMRELYAANSAEADAVARTARPGDRIWLTGINYIDPLNIYNSGTQEATIVFISQSVGSARLRKGFQFSDKITDVMVHGFDLFGSNSGLSGERNTIRRCLIRPPYNASGNSIGISVKSGKFLRIDYCTLDLLTDDMIPGKWPKDVYCGIRGVFRASPSFSNSSQNLASFVNVEKCFCTNGPAQAIYGYPYGGYVVAGPNVSETYLECFWLIADICVRNSPMKQLHVEAKAAKVHFKRFDCEGAPGSYVALRNGVHSRAEAMWLEGTAFRVFRGPHTLLGTHLLGSRISLMAGHQSEQGTLNGWPRSFEPFVADTSGTGSIIMGEDFGALLTFPCWRPLIDGYGSSIKVVHNRSRDGTDLCYAERLNRSVQAAGLVYEKAEKIDPASVGHLAPWVGVRPFLEAY